MNPLSTSADTKHNAGEGVTGAGVTVTAPARLHFGLLRFGEGYPRQFGGGGVMLDEPTLSVAITDSETLQVIGPPRVMSVVHRWAEEAHAGQLPACRIAVTRMIDSHCGLGSGTQLALAVAMGLCLYHGHPRPTADELAILTQRGRRSAVGTHGFLHGGLIAELGRLAHEPLSPLYRAVPLPGSWRVVLFRGAAWEGLAGEAERTAFRQLPPVTPTVARRLETLLCDELVSAAEQGTFCRFAEALGEYGELAGSCFSTCQGGPFACAEIASFVQACRATGYAGAGQSSWGPTAFAFAESEAAAKALQQELAPAFPQARITITRPNQGGAIVS